MSKLHWTKMGWNDYTLLKLLERFIEEENMSYELSRFLQHVADEELEESELIEWFEMHSPGTKLT